MNNFTTYVIDDTVNIKNFTYNPVGLMSFVDGILSEQEPSVWSLKWPRAALDNVIITRLATTRQKNRRSCRLKCSSELITTCPILSWKSYQNLKKTGSRGLVGVGCAMYFEWGQLKVFSQKLRFQNPKIWRHKYCSCEEF